MATGEDLVAEVRQQFADLREQARTAGLTASDVKGIRARARSAMDWLEDTDEFENAHVLLDEIGRFIRTEVEDACLVTYEGGEYFNECPVSLAHSRVGMSIGFVVHKAECSICHLDPWDCEHITGRTYDGERCYRIITDAEVFEVSLVARPAQPDARIHKIGMPLPELREALGADFEPGIGVVCDRCLTDCDGVSRAFEQGASARQGST